MEEDEVPEVYMNLLKRVEELEKTLSKTTLESKSAQNMKMGDHAKEQKLKPFDSDELETEKITPVLLSSKTFLKLAIHAKKYANQAIKQSKWVEVIGLLTGRIKNEDTPMEQILVRDAWPIGHGDAVSVSIMETGSVSQIMQELPKGDFIVGWYHSHPSYGNFLSIDDYNTQARYQALWSKAVALVIDPTQISKSDYGFSVFRNTHKEPGSKGYTQLGAKIDGMEPPAAFDTLNLVSPAFEGKDLNFLEYGN